MLQKSGGFTLIELLVTMVISSIILGSLLGFMNNILNSDKQEQAKAFTENETQEALDYIANDLQQTVYIYDATGIAAIQGQLPNPTDTNKVPVLVFWKRSFFPKDRQVTSKISGNTTTVGCLVQIPGATPGSTQCDNRDYFVYSLVAYYLIKDDSSTTWSKVATRIARFEIQDGIKDPYSSSYLTDADPGFQQFDLNQTGTLQEKMNLWRKNGNYNLSKNPIDTLVDYIDQNKADELKPPSNFCTTTTSTNAQMVPADNSTANPRGIYSFYACVDSSKTLARVYIRGNALARTSNNASYTSNQSTYFPTVSVLIKNRGLLGDK